MRFLSIVTLAFLASVPRAGAALNVVASTEDVADLTRQVGGDKVKVESIARGYQDPHYVEAKPSFILKLAKADLLVVHPGLFWSDVAPITGRSYRRLVMAIRGGIGVYSSHLPLAA